MGFWERLFGKSRAPRTRSASSEDEYGWGGTFASVPSIAGVNVNQVTALNASAVMACVTMLAEDVAKLTPTLYRRLANGGRIAEKDHFLYDLLYRPNDWQDGLEFREMMQVQLILRGNAYAVIARNGAGMPIKLIPVNADRVAMWEASTGELFYKITPLGMHEMAELKGQPFLIPAEDVFHLRGFSLNGLMGSSRIALAKEAIGLGLAQEQLASRWMVNSARPSGVLTTEQQLNDATAARMAQSWKDGHAGLQNAGKIALLEAGVKFQALSSTSSDMEFIASRQFQLQEFARIFRVPPHMIGELSKSSNNNIAQQSQDYANFTLTGYTRRWDSKLDVKFDLRASGLFVDYDWSTLTRADMTTRYNAYRTGIMSMFLTPNEARLDDGRDPMPEGDKLFQPANMAAAGSQSTGTKADGGGRPASGETPIS